MDNFRQYRPPRRSAVNSVDGFVSNTSNRAGVVRQSSSNLAGRGRVDSFASSGNFRSRQQQIHSGKPAQYPQSRGAVYQATQLDMQLPQTEPTKRRKQRARGRGPKKVLKVFGVLFIIGILGSGAFAGKAYFAARNVLKGGGDAPSLAKTIDVSKLNGEGDGRVNVLLLGAGGSGHEGADLTDTMILASIDPINKKAALLSIPRDLWVKLPNNFIASQHKINAAYESGKYAALGVQSESNDNDQAIQAGFDAVDSVIEDVLGVPVHYNVLVNFRAFEQAIDTVGGVSVNVPEDLVDSNMAWENNNNPILARAGLQTMQGERALMYVRSRYSSSDFARAERQRAVMVALKDKIFTAGTLSNPSKISDLISTFGDNVVSDISVGDAARMAEIMRDIPNDSIQSVGLTDESVRLLETTQINNLSAVQPVAGLFVYDDIHAFARNVLKDGFIEKENANIGVFNGTITPGLAGARAKDLQSFGYNITDVANAPGGVYANSVIVDLTGNKPVTKRYLEQRFDVRAITELPTGLVPTTGADFVIILGDNEKISQ